MIAGKRYFGLNVDIWSCGVILFAMICGYLPFEDPNTSALYKKIMNAEYEIPRFVSADAADLMRCILNTDPTQRYTISDIRKHVWYNQVRSKEREGIVVGVNPIPVDPQILQQMSPFDFDLEEAQKALEANKHNHTTTTYFLLMKKHIEAGGKSIADLNSEEYDPQLFIRPPHIPGFGGRGDPFGSSTRATASSSTAHRTLSTLV